jgi:hypothetical protein
MLLVFTEQLCDTLLYLGFESDSLQSTVSLLNGFDYKRHTIITCIRTDIFITAMQYHSSIWEIAQIHGRIKPLYLFRLKKITSVYLHIVEV